jgi:hypothetical protein
VALAVVAARLLWLSRAWPLVHDAPIMHYLAWRIGGGAIPYRDLFDMNFPGVYLLHMVLLSTLGPGDAAWRAFDLAWLGLGALAIAALAAPWGFVASAGGAFFFTVYHLANGAWQAGQRDFVLCAFLVAGALGVARWGEAAPRARRPVSTRAWLALGGLVLGAGSAIKPQAGVFLAALAVIVAGVAWRARRPLGATLAIFLLPAALVPAAVFAWVAALGGLEAWRAIVVEYLVPLYSRLGRPSSWAFHRWHVWIPIGAAVLVSLGDALLRRRFTFRHGVVAVGIAYGLAHFFAQGKGWEYHLYPLAAFAGVALFSALEPVRARGRPAGLILAASLAAVVVLLNLKGVEAADPAWIRDKTRGVDEIVRRLDGRLEPGATVQVLDTTDGGVHALLRLRAVEPTRFIYDFHFFHDSGHPTIQALRTEFARALAARPPRFIVLFERGWPAGGYERVERFPELARALRAYAVDARGEGYVIFVSERGSGTAGGGPR